MKKIIIMITAAMLIISGCNKAVPPVQSPEPTVTPTAAVTPAPTAGEKKLTMKATYGGRADSNFIEVILEDGSFETLKLSDEMKENLENLGIEDDDKIEITYTEENGVKTVTEIKEN